MVIADLVCAILHEDRRDNIHLIRQSVATQGGLNQREIICIGDDDNRSKRRDNPQLFSMLL